MRTLNLIGRAAALGLVFFAALGFDANAGPTTDFTVTGGVAAPATYTRSTLQALPNATGMVSYRTGSGPRTGTFSGPTLWSLLNAVGLRSPVEKNGLLRQYVVATGSDGYQAAYSLGELDPMFGGSGRPD